MKQVFFLLLTLIIFISPAPAQGKKILYVPIDNRPCNLHQVVQVAEKLDYEILTPPEEILGSKNFGGDSDKMWQWLYENASQAECAVLSTDALIYGSLVSSRLHDLTAEEILLRAEKFKTFHEKFPYLPIYAFGTIMRTPRSGNHASFEPEYYYTHGAMIFNYTALLDKQEMNMLNSGDKRKLKKLEADIPKEYLDDWFKRRSKNFDVNELFIDYARIGVFEYFILGCDDSAMFSQTHKESRKLAELASDMGKTVIQVTSGADELGMLMIARAINIDLDQRPFIAVMYNNGTGAETFPAYSNEPIGVSVDAAIIAAGGLRIPNYERADLVVVVNTRSNGKTFEASSNKNKLKLRGDLKPVISIIKDLTAKNYSVALADISFSNGADNSLMNQLKREDLQFKIQAYGGWNTATNSSGFLIGESVLTKFMNKRNIAELLTTRYLDDWAYQANVRQDITAECYRLGVDPYKLDDVINQINSMTNEKVKDFADENLRLPNRWHFEEFNVNLPWLRIFECDPRFKLAN